MQGMSNFIRQMEFYGGVIMELFLFFAQKLRWISTEK